MQLNILFISDADHFVLEMIGFSIENSLEDCTVQSIICETEKEILHNLDYNDINLIVADMDIKSLMVGLLYDELQNDDRYKDVAFVFISSNKDDMDIALLKGMDNFFLKPITNVDGLLNRIAIILEEIKNNKKSEYDVYSLIDDDDSFADDIYNRYV
jgi:CheY-like chemotaxis protein